MFGFFNTVSDDWFFFLNISQPGPPPGGQPLLTEDGQELLTEDGQVITTEN